MALTAMADTQTWRGTKTFNADEVIYDPVELDGEVTVSVASDKTVIISNAVSDVSGKKGKITLVGGGTLTLANANTFTGGAYIDTGVLATTIADSLGTGDITIDGGTTKKSQLWFLFSDGVNPNTTITVANKISILNGGNSTYRQIRYTPGAKEVMKYLKLTGGLTCAGDLYWYDDNTWSANIGRAGMYFYCDITVDGELNFSWPTMHAQFSGAVKAKKISSGSASNGSGSFYFYSSQNSIGQFSPYRMRIECAAADVLGGASFVGSSSSSTSPYINLAGCNQTMAYLKTSGTILAKNIPHIQNATSYAAATLTLTGGVEKAVFHGRFWIDNKNGIFNGSLRVNAATQPNFTQVITNLDHTINGSAIVDAGNLVFNGDTTLTNLTGIVVNGGTFTLDTTDTGDIPALKSLAAITVKKGAKLTLKGANLFGTVAKTLDLETGALIDIPATTFEVSSLTVDGRTWAAGQYTSSMLPMLPAGVTLNVTAGTWGTTSIDVNWTGGAGADKATTTAANWENSTLPVNTGAAKVSVTGGEGMDFADGDWFYQIEGAVTPSTDNKVDTFTIQPASEGATLHLGHGINFTQKTQLILSGHITDLPENNSAKDNRVYYYPAITGGVVNAIQPTLVPKNGVLPLVLKNVTLDMPLYTVSVYNQVVLMSYAHTTNVVNGLTTITGTTYDFDAESGSLIRMLGGFYSGFNTSFIGSGEFEIGNYVSIGRGANIMGGSTLSLNTTNGCAIIGPENKDFAGVKIASGTLKTLSDNVLADTMEIKSEKASSAAKFELNGTTQTVGVINFNASANNTSSYLHGDFPAKLTVTGKLQAKNAGIARLQPYCSARIDGWLSLCYTGEGTNEVFTLKNRAFESYGDLEVSGKKLLLDSGATWRNGTNFTARGSGVLAFTAANQVNSDFAVLHIADTGKVEIADKVTNVVYRAETNGVWLAAGNYTCLDGGAEGATGIQQLRGTGVLSVRGDDKVTTYDASASGEPNVKTVIVSNSWMEANVPTGKTITDTPENGNGYPYWKSYVLGLTPTNPVSKPIIKGVQNADPANLAFRLGNVTYNAASGVNATYKVKASNTVNGSSWTDVSAEVGADKDATVALPTDSPVKYYRVHINYSN